MGRQRDLMCGLSEQESSLKTPERSGIDPTVAIFASAALSVKRHSEGFENSIKVLSCCGPACGCSPSCDCKPECHCEGFAIDPNTVTLVASVARTAGVLMMPSEGSKKSIEAEGGHPSKTRNDSGQMATMPMWIDHGSCSQPHDKKK